KPTGGTRILTLKDDFTTLSLTCHPLDKSQDGPELWTLIALRTEGTPKINSAAELVEWIQNQRRHDHLPALSIGNKSLQGLVDKAAQQRDLHHPHALLLKEKQKLKSQKIDLLGEDRVSARDFSAIANLLWNSPQHRRLLLNPRANAIVLNVSDRENQKFVVMILANL
ncbi:MAG: hypothetical protein H7249_01165, partial [Chitinophagaceae bacterium]|nr:hypothetical protein [Oligoflexus sp.]